LNILTSQPRPYLRTNVRVPFILYPLSIIYSTFFSPTGPGPDGEFTPRFLQFFLYQHFKERFWGLIMQSYEKKVRVESKSIPMWWL